MSACECNLLSGYTPVQKALGRVLYPGLMVLGTYAVFQHDARWGFAYLAFVAAGHLLVVLPSLCRHCPYPAGYHDCLLAPATAMRRLLPFRGPNTSRAGRVGIVAVALGSFLLPQYWLGHDLFLFGIYWTAALVLAVFFSVRVCTRCRHKGCPFNRVSGSTLCGQASQGGGQGRGSA